MHKKSLSHTPYLFQGTSDGKSIWHYVLVEKIRMPQLMAAIKQGQVDIKTFGQVLFSGFGKGPPHDIILYIRRRYG